MIDDANKAGADEADKTIVADKIVAANEAIWL
jgi:hypothetical protein